MINHVNTVLVSNNTNALEENGEALKGFKTKEEAIAKRGNYIVFDPDNNAYTISENTRQFKIGMFDGTYYVKYDKNGTAYVPNVRWSNTIQLSAIQSINVLKYAKNKDEKVTIDFTDVADKLPQGASVTLRIQYKDMPTRYRQWSESYNYLMDNTEDDAKLASVFAELINKEHKRQRVFAEIDENDSKKLVLTGMPYDDPKIYDQGYENTVRFNVVMYYANPQADGITFHNKYSIPFKNPIKKEEAERYPADSVIVRTREIEAWDYMGVLHRCCWFDPTPKVMTDLENQYDGLIIEFENEYHAADDIRRHTKETVELYATTKNAALTAIKTGIETALDKHKKFVTEEDKQLPEAAAE